MSPQIPVFSYHKIEKYEFESQLRYLLDNGYTTLDADEFLSHQLSKKPSPERAVVLTFDDGLDDLYTVAYPLLKSFGMKAIAFIIPAWIGQPGAITWEQANEMHQTGAMDFQSHTMHHTGIFISPKVSDFYHRRYMSHQIWNIPVHKSNGADHHFELPEPGMPIFKNASRLSDHQAILPGRRIN